MLKHFKNDNEVVLATVNKSSYALKYASPQLQNDLELLNLLDKFYNFPENIIENEDRES